MKKYLLSIFPAVLLLCTSLHAQQVISDKQTPGSFSLTSAAIYVDTLDFELVKKSALLFQADVEMVTGKRLPLIHKLDKSYKAVIIIGSIGKSSLVKELIRKNTLKSGNLSGKWEAYQIQSIWGANTQAASQKVLVVAGSDRRGTAYAVFELSKQLGVSPWYWWADVPVKKQSSIYIAANAFATDAPKVKYRGIFINDEAPAFTGWAREKFGGLNHKVYEKVFELILRLKGNYLWPAMWGNAFNDDDTLNPVKADEWGIVMGTSHHEPMLRSQQEWKRYGKGHWDYTKNDTALKSFWRTGIRNMGQHESLLTVGMRGDGDEPMTDGTATELLEKIVKDQRQIIEEVTGKPAEKTPQLWALYKEVQDYYDQGMRVPDDVTLLLCDDNWGNLRKLPKPGEKPRKGGYGIYYHFDYVGGPRNYKWINTNPIPRVWEQMNLAWQHDVRQIWLVNVGDIKPMEFPVSFFLDFAWNPEKIGADDLQKYTEQWAAAQFGGKYAKDIANIVSKYGKYNGRRKPELLDANTYSMNYNEWCSVVDDYNTLLKKAEHINSQLPPQYKAAYFQLVLHPVKASANLNEMYYNVALNKEAYKNKQQVANTYADKVKHLYNRDSLITLEYHRLNNGKWNHMMSQKHIGYTYWQEPQKQRMPDVQYLDAGLTAQTETIAGPAPRRAEIPSPIKGNVFYQQEERGVSIEAAHFTKAINANGITWKILPDHGRTGSAITAFPVTAPQQALSRAAVVEYEIYTYSAGAFHINCYFSPTLNFLQLKEGLQYAISVDDEKPQVISINKEDKNSISGVWNKWVAESIIIKSSKHTIAKPGKHTVKYRVINPGVVLQKLVLDFGGNKPSYFGPPETKK